MQLTAGHVIQFLMVAASLIGAFAVVKSQLQRVLEDLHEINKELESINRRLDTNESENAVFQHQISVLSSILSPANLKSQHEQLADLSARMRQAEYRIDRNATMHNGKHPGL
tara:strand:- start:58 stop:393 length:336 start_codon:yes stop_codon:yes gene_type:complete